MLAQVATITGIVGVMSSLLFAGFQARELLKQSRFQNAIAGAAVKQATVDAHRDVMKELLSRPTLVPHFFEGEPAPNEEPARSETLLIADMLVDAVDTGLLACSRIRDKGSYDDWKSYALYLRDHSPVVADYAAQHATWFPFLTEIYSDKSSQT